MQIRSPLSNISEILSQVKSSAALYQNTLNKNEAATRAVLIDPILQALGWDTANTFMVEVEKTDATTKTRVDYALYDNSNSVKIVIEAKLLGSNLNHPDVKKAIIQYAHTYGIQDIYVTDGLIWHHFTNFTPGSVTATKTLDVAHDDPIDCAAYLVQRLDAAKYWPEEPDIDALQQQIRQLESTLSTLQQEVAQLKLAGTPAVNTPAVGTAQPLAVPSIVPHVPAANFVNLDALPNVTGTKPSGLRLPDGRVINVKSWLDVLRECCKFVLASNPSIPIPFADKSGKKVSLISSVRPPRGISSVEEQYNGRPIYIYLNYDANNHVANALHVLKQLPPNKQVMKAAVAYG